MRRTVLALLLAAATAAGAGAAVAGPSAADRKRVVVGSDSFLFITQDWTVPCQDAGTASRTGSRMGQLADALRSGGREPVVVLGPDKATIRSGNVVAARVPGKSCADTQKAALWSAATEQPDVLDLRRPLAAAGARSLTYWRKDSHWTPTGGGVYAQQLAKRLDPTLPSHLTSRAATFSRRGDLATTLQQPADETVQGLQLVNPGASVREGAQRDVGLTNPVRTTTATPGPDGQVLPGRTVFVGDSFDAVAIGQLAPLFATAVFVWVTPGEPLQPVLDELRPADRVVLESVERYAARSRWVQSDALAGIRALPHR